GVFFWLGTNAWPAVPHLLSLAQDADPSVRRQSYKCLASIRLPRQSLQPLLTPLLQNTNPVISSESHTYLWEEYREELQKEGLVLSRAVTFGLTGSNIVPRAELRSVGTNGSLPTVVRPEQTTPRK